MSAMSTVDLMDPMEMYVVNDDVILFEDTEMSPAMDIYDYREILNYIQPNYDCLSTFNYDKYDGKISMLIDVLCYCSKISANNREVIEIIINLMPYITKENPSYNELMTHPIIPKLISYFEDVDIKNDDPMFMAYYRVLRSLKN